MEKKLVKKVLLIGYGNPGRLDDGLGPAFAERIEEKDILGLKIDSNYQLNVEDAAEIAKYDIVVFADASVNAPEPYSFEEIQASSQVTFSTHSITAENVLGLARDMFQSQAVGYAMAIRGYDFNEFGQKLSEQAKVNLKAAVDFFVYKIGDWL